MILQAASALTLQIVTLVVVDLLDLNFGAREMLSLPP
jgi:hypothetical protein